MSHVIFDYAIFEMYLYYKIILILMINPQFNWVSLAGNPNWPTQLLRKAVNHETGSRRVGDLLKVKRPRVGRPVSPTNTWGQASASGQSDSPVSVFLPRDGIPGRRLSFS